MIDKNDLKEIMEVELRKSLFTVAKDNAKFIVEIRRKFGGFQTVFRFPNKLGASVICFKGSYGEENGNFELAVQNYDGSLNYKTKLTADVIGNQDSRQINNLLRRIRKLKPKKRKQK